MEPQIQPVGPIPARIMFVGEAPGETEVREGKPFVGAAGRILDGLLRDAGIVRELCYITNIMLVRPEGNDFGRFYEDKARRRPTEDLQEGIRRLHEEIIRVQPNVVVALGEEPLRALTELRGVSAWRGSILKGITGHKVISTFHPAAISREWKFRAASLIDFHKVLKESISPEINITSRQLEITYASKNALEILTSIKAQAKEVSFDIETESGQITAISFAVDYRPNWAVSIPFWFGSSGSLHTQEDEHLIWTLIQEILINENIGKIAQNGSYDIEFIERLMGFRVRNFTFDTMLGMHCLYLELPKRLSFINSIYTDQPYYKDDINSSDMETYFRYNALDACITMEIANIMRQEIKDEGLWEFYHEYIHALWEPLMEMQIKGVKFDWLRKNTIKKRFQEEVAITQKRLDAAVGHPLNTSSPKQMKEWLYEDLKLKVKTKKRKDTGEETITADDGALEDLYAETQNESLKTVLKIREKQKLISNYLDVTLDEDKRIRCSYLITGTETGRLSSRATARGTGTNLQNIPAGPIKTLFIPDEKRVFINADLSQAEARVVAYLANESRLIKVFEEGGDIHRKNAANIFGISEGAVSDEQRQLAKRVVHASNYGMGPITFSKTAGISAAEAKRLLNQYFATYPGIANWHHEIKAQLQKRRYLITPLGRKRIFFNRWAEPLFKEGLAYIPQSTVADIVTKGLIKLHRRKEEIKGLDILLQVHDSILVQTYPENVDSTAALIKSCLQIPVEICGKVLTIPVDFKIGNNWQEMEKYTIVGLSL